jgi:hypothetical protein
MLPRKRTRSAKEEPAVRKDSIGAVNLTKPIPDAVVEQDHLTLRGDEQQI